MMIGLISYLVFFLIVSLIFSISVLGLNMQWGFTGLFNAGVAGFVAIGGYTMAILTGPSREVVFGGFELPFIIGLIALVSTRTRYFFSKQSWSIGNSSGLRNGSPPVKPISRVGNFCSAISLRKNSTSLTSRKERLSFLGVECMKQFLQAKLQIVPVLNQRVRSSDKPM